MFPSEVVFVLRTHDTYRRFRQTGPQPGPIYPGAGRDGLSTRPRGRSCSRVGYLLARIHPQVGLRWVVGGRSDNRICVCSKSVVKRSGSAIGDALPPTGPLSVEHQAVLPHPPPRQSFNSADLGPESRVNPVVNEKDTQMTHTRTQSGAGLALDAWVVEQAFRSGQRAERVRGRVRAAQHQKIRSKSGACAKVYEEAAELRDPGDREECQEHAARHRAFAQNDHRMAQQLRQMAESDPTANPSAPSSNR